MRSSPTAVRMARHLTAPSRLLLGGSPHLPSGRSRRRATGAWSNSLSGLELERVSVRGGGGDGVREVGEIDVVRGLEQLLSETDGLVRESTGARLFDGAPLNGDRANERRPTSAASPGLARSASRKRKSATLPLMPSSSPSLSRSRWSSSTVAASACCSQERLTRRASAGAGAADRGMGCNSWDELF